LPLQGTTYRAPFSCDLVYQAEGGTEQRLSKRLGSLPIMLKSKACYLRNMTRRELVARKVGAGLDRGGWRRGAAAVSLVLRLDCRQSSASGWVGEVQLWS
jgi:hypothetical protein